MVLHPEASANEVFLGNVQCVPAYLSGLATVRLGKVAYDHHGKSITAEGYRPMMIARSEVERYDNIMMTRTFGPGWRNR